MLIKVRSKSVFIPGAILVVALSLVFARSWAAEPEMATYTSYPVFLAQTTTPNIMIILDNSGSMNEPAYPVGEPYKICGQIEAHASDSRDDGEEIWGYPVDGSSYSYSSDLDMGALDAGGTQKMLIGIRFPNLGIPQGSVITTAEIRFRAVGTTGGAAQFKIVGEASDDAQQFRNASWQPNDGGYDIKNRPETAAQVDWILTVGEGWSGGERSADTTTPELKTILQEIVNRPGWTNTSAMGFKIIPVSGKRDAYSADNGTDYEPVLYVEYVPSEECYKYYGYFNPNSRYSYASGKFYMDPNGVWDGDWLNWLTMRKIDVARKVLMGGLATSRQGGGNQVNYGEGTGKGNRTFYKSYDNPSATTGVSPYAGNVTYKMDDGYIYVGSTKYTIAVDKYETQEPDDFYQGNLAGVLQKVGNKARWGNMWFYVGEGNNKEGGFVSSPIGTNITSLVSGIQNRKANTWTPLAETYYICTQYFKQETPEALGFANNATGPLNHVWDPYYDDEMIECAKSFVILLTDGASTKDSKVPAALRDFDGDGDAQPCNESTGANCDYSSGGTDYLDDVALYARTTDLRADLAGDQSLILYCIYAFGQDENARKLLKDAAKNGGFDDKNGNNIPDLDEEWDDNGDGLPDTYFEASNGYLLEKQIMAAITDILKRASSGTAVSVLATSSEGEGTLVQAYFKPSITEGLEEVTWVGYLHSLWVDSLGQIREDTEPQGSQPGLVLSYDRIVEFYFDSASGEAKFKRFQVNANGEKQRDFTDLNGNGILDEEEPYIDLNDNGVWDAGEPFADDNGNGILDAPEAYNDLNHNGVWDAGDPYTDLNGNGIWDNEEPFDDFDSSGDCCGSKEPCSGGYEADGSCDMGEPFTDTDGDCAWTPAEPFLEGGVTLRNADPLDPLNGYYRFNELTDTFIPGLHDTNGNGVWNGYEDWLDEDGDGVFDPGNFVAATDDLNGNCAWDGEEPYTDRNLNGVWDQAEPYVDANGDGVYTPPEPLIDENGNGVWDDGETFTDLNGNGLYDPVEPYSDENGDGVWTAGEPWWYLYTEHIMDELEPIWEGGLKLAARVASNRTIKTWVDLNNNGLLEDTEFLSFDTVNLAAIKPFLGVKDLLTWSYLGSDTTADARAENLIKYTRGESTGFTGTTDLRNRTIGGNIWKLGDIIYSTPVTVGRPMDNFGLIYSDQTYQDYYNLYLEREQVVYVGGNDGMLHAFYMGKYQSGDDPSTAGVTEQVYFTKDTGTLEGFGDELWAYIPQALLPHLKWLANPDYTHVYYVDLKPRVVDAKIFLDDATHPNGWGTVLLCGLRFGGKSINATDDFPEGADTTRTFTSSFFAFDVTDPHNPVLLWEKALPNSGLTTSSPTIAKVGDKWFAIMGSGPTDYDGTSIQQAHVFIVNLETGELLRDFVADEADSFMGSGPVTVDVGLNYNVDVGYIGLTHYQGGSWLGTMYRLRVPKTSGDWRVTSQSDVYDDDPAHWEFAPLMAVDGPLTASPGVSIDARGSLWVYFGTGRYYSDADKIDTNQQYFYGVKDPLYNDLMYDTEAAATSKPPTGYVLLDSTPIYVYTDSSVTGAPAGVETWADLLTLMKTKDGWILSLGQDALYAGERVLNKPTILGGIVFDTTYFPNQDPCGFGGGSNIIGMYYETGTAYIDEVFLGGSEEVVVGGQTKSRVSRSMSLGVGRGSSVSIHVGQQEEGATGYIQQSTGIVQGLAINPAFKLRSGFIYWRER